MSYWKEIGGFWSLSDTFTVLQAAALIAGFDPNSIDSSRQYFRDPETNQTDSDGISDLTAVEIALTNAINAGKLKATIRRDARLQAWDELPNFGESARPLDPIDPMEIPPQYQSMVIYCEAPAWDKTTIDREDLIEWLRSRGHTKGFFFPEESNSPDYLNPSNPRFPRKLAAAVHAWLAVADPGAKTPKQALDKWLRENAARFGLTNDEGNPINTAIEECSKVANWQPEGGAAKTPGG